jgi:glutamate--cysteine ligase
VSEVAPAQLTRDDCLAYLEQHTFRLRSADYSQKYPKWPGAVGIEIEMLPVRPAPLAIGSRAELPAPVRLQGDGESIAAALTALARDQGWRTETVPADDGGRDLLSRLETDQGDSITFEPGGQVEFSSVPYPCLTEVAQRAASVQETLGRAFAAHGVEIVQIGINPWHLPDELGLQMPKSRYRAMDAYYTRLSPYGRRMMRQTCTVQVNLDFGADETTLAKRYLASQLLAPVAAATFAYSAFVDRQPAGAKSFRTKIWRHADPTHTGLVGLERIGAKLSRSECVATYFDFAMRAHVVFVTELGYKVPERPLTFADWLAAPYEGVRPTLEDFKTHLSLLFPEARPRGFIELRSLDCQPRAFQMVPASYYTGLLYNAASLDRVIELLLPRQATLSALLVAAQQGLDDPSLAALAKTVMDFAMTGFEQLPSCFKADGCDKRLAVFRDLFT